MATQTKKYKPLNRERMNGLKPRASDILDLLEQVRDHGDRIAYRYYVGKDIKDMTYSQLHTAICQCAAAFDTMGLKGQRVAVIGDTSPQWIITYMATLAAGCVAVPMDKELDPTEICKFLNIVEAKALPSLPTWSSTIQTIARLPTSTPRTTLKLSLSMASGILGQQAVLPG